MLRLAILGTSAFLACASLTGCGVNNTAAQDGGADRTDAAQNNAINEPSPEVMANGTLIEIKMLTTDPDDPNGLQVFKPQLVKARVGDTIRFVATDETHNSSSIETMLPEGVLGWEGDINEEVTFVVPKEGVYGYKCLPHYAAGMVGLIVVEGGDNVEAAKKVRHPGRAGRAFAELFEQAGL